MLRQVSKQNWKVCVGVLLQRWPTVAPAQTELEKQYAALQRTIEDERSLLSNHELRHRNDAKKIAEMKAEAAKQRSGRTEEQALFVTAREDEQRWQAEWDDLKRLFEKNTKLLDDAGKQALDWRHETARTTNRLLDRSLYLIVDQRFNGISSSSPAWTLPTLSWNESLDGFYLRRTANRILSNLAAGEFRLGDAPARTLTEGETNASFDYRLLSNAPCGFTKWRFSAANREKLNAVGVKLFIYKAHLIGGNLKPKQSAVLTPKSGKKPERPASKSAPSTTNIEPKESSEVVDFRWCSQEELGKLYSSSLVTRHYARMLKPLLIN